MVWGLVARGAAMAAARLAPKVATKIPRVVPAITRAVAKITAPAVAPLRKVAARVTAKVPALTPVTRRLRAAVGIPAAPAAPMAIARTLPVAARPATALKAAVSKVAVGMVEKPFRTALPYVATAGLLGAVSRIGEEKAVTVAERGALVGKAITGAPLAPAALVKRGMVRTVGEVPIPEPTIVRSWTTGTTDFAVDSTGQHWVLTKSGWKKYTPKKPIVLGTKHLTPKKFIAAAKKYYGLKKDLDKVFKTVKRKK